MAKDEFQKQICKNEMQLLKKIENGAKIVICYNFIVSKETAELIKEKQIKIIGVNRTPKKKRGK